MDDFDLIDAKTASEYLRISRPYLYYLVKTKQIKHIRVGKKLFFTKQLINEFLVANLIKDQANETKRSNLQ